MLSPDPRPGKARDRRQWVGAGGRRAAILYYYQAGQPLEIGLARSTNGHQWETAGPPVLPPGPRGAWDERGVADPYVIRIGRELLHVLSGQDRARGSGWAWRRSDDGVTGLSCGAIRSWNWARTARSTRTGWASRRCGGRADITGCCTRARARRNPAAGHWRARAMAWIGKSFR